MKTVNVPKNINVPAVKAPARSKAFQRKVIATGALGLILLGLNAAVRWRGAPRQSPPAVSLAAATSFEAQQREAAQTMDFLAHRVKSDPEDFLASDMLAGAYLHQVRETGNLDSLVRAEHLARASLASVPEVKNVGGLATLTRTEFMAYQWTAARDHAARLTVLDAGEGEPYGMLGDAELELGDYDKAGKAFQTMAGFGGGIGTETRLGRYALLHGDPRAAGLHYSNAASLGLAQPDPPRETVAWCRWQKGETEFLVGRYPAAEQDYRAALASFPKYYLALASLGRVRAAQGDYPGAIKYYEQAVGIIPYPTSVGALGDLYRLTNRPQDAAAQYALVAQIRRLSRLNGELYNRQYALFYADHDLKPQEAYAEASREYAVRRDIYGADAVAWTALKAGKVAVAQARIKEALRLDTQDALLFYHAGMIARAAGDTPRARFSLGRALALCPQFDPLQARIARKALAGLPAGA